MESYYVGLVGGKDNEYQNEYRYLIVDELEERKNIRFEIGDLKDLATIMSKSEFLKTL